MRIITSQYWVDPAVHEDGELIEFEPAAKIPQVKRHWDFGGRRLWRLPAIHSPMAS